MRNAFTLLRLAPRRVACACITLYQRTLSPDHGPLKELYDFGCCKHSPTCSEYAKQRIGSDGVLVGGMKAFSQIIRCNPFTKPSDDVVGNIIAKTSQGEMK